MLGDHGLIQKNFFYEEASRIPLAIRVPALGLSHRMIEEPVSQIDLVPTLLDLMGQPVGEHLQGTSRAGVLRGEETMDGNDAFLQWNTLDPEEGGRSIVSADGWKLNLYAADNNELYDLNSDPCELTNRFLDPSHQDRVRAMAARLKSWQESTSDPLKLEIPG
jgi:arylsulfatase A-like enzyme